MLYIALSSSLFKPEVSVPGVPVAGDSFAITCTLDGVVEKLVGVQVDVEFINSPGGVSINQTEKVSTYMREQIFDPGRTSDVGNYTCRVVITFMRIRPLVNYGSGNLQIKSKAAAFIGNFMTLMCNC